MNLKFLDDFRDPYMKTPEGRGALLAGVLLGYMAHKQASQPLQEEGGQRRGLSPEKSPLFKQLQFGRLDMRSLKRILARVPTLVRAYAESLAQSTGNLNRLCAEASELLLRGSAEDLGVDGNFAFTVGFTNCVDYYWKMFGDPGKAPEE